jgi:hypothetical protein
MYVYAPALEAAASAVFMVWPRACARRVCFVSKRDTVIGLSYFLISSSDRLLSRFRREQVVTAGKRVDHSR